MSVLQMTDPIDMGEVGGKGANLMRVRLFWFFFFFFIFFFFFLFLDRHKPILGYAVLGYPPVHHKSSCGGKGRRQRAEFACGGKKSDSRVSGQIPGPVLCS
jgi:hypothetical protein